MPCSRAKSVDSRKVSPGHFAGSKVQVPTVPHQSLSGEELSGAAYHPASIQRKSTFTSSAIIFSRLRRQVKCRSEIEPSEFGSPVSPARQQVENGSSGVPAPSAFGRLYRMNQLRQRFVAYCSSRTA